MFPLWASGDSKIEVSMLLTGAIVQITDNPSVGNQQKKEKSYQSVFEAWERQSTGDRSGQALPWPCSTFGQTNSRMIEPRFFVLLKSVRRIRERRGIGHSL